MREIKIVEKGSLEHQLIKCCRNGSPEDVRALLDAGAAADAKMPTFDFDTDWEIFCGYSAVHIAAMNPDIRVIELLVGRGADVNVTDVCGNTPLCCAARENTLEMVRYLVSLGNDPLLENLNGDNLLTIAACNPHKDVPEYFLRQGVDIEGVSDIVPLGEAMRYGTPADMDFFIAHGASMENALACVCQAAPPENIRHLLTKGCDVNAVFSPWDGERIDWTRLPDGPLRTLFLEFGAKSDEELDREKRKDAMP